MAEQIVFETEEGQAAFFVLDQTRLYGVNYLLVSESEDDEAECYILKDTSKDEDQEAVYEFVEDDETLEALGALFAEQMGDDTVIE